jgi:hypothetical protein
MNTGNLDGIYTYNFQYLGKKIRITVFCTWNMLSPYSGLNMGTAGSIETSVQPVYETTQQHASDYLHINTYCTLHKITRILG